MKSVYNHHHRSRENVPQDFRANRSERRKRRAEQRKEQRAAKKAAIRERMKANPRLVRA